MYEDKRKRHRNLESQLKTERSSFEPSWRDSGEFILPTRPRFLTTDANRGDRRNQKIIDNTATMAARTLRSGMMSGITSPARPWFRLTTPDPDLAEFGNVKQWLHIVSQRMSTVYQRSNIYNILPQTYGDMGVFATGAMLIEEDFTTVINCQSLPIGSYYLAKDARGRINTFFREMRMTVSQLVSRFGKKDDGSKEIDWSKFSEQVKTAWDNSNYETWIEVRHVITPNPEYNPRSPLSKYKKFESCYYEASSNQDGKYLSEKGYDYFPVLAPRWGTTGEDVYGTDCPGFDTIGDIKQLQLGEKKSLQAIEKMINPPMVGSVNLKGQKTSILPGDITWEEDVAGAKGFRPAHEVNFSIRDLEGKQEQCRQRIKKGFYEDLFLMLTGSTDADRTAYEIAQRKEEKLLALGPVLEQTNDDLLDPITDITFSTMLIQGWIPPAPDELKGVPLKVDYISILQEAQKALGITGVERFVNFVSGMANGTQNMSVLDKLNMDQTIDVYSEMVSVPPSIVRTDDEVAEIRQQRAQAQQAQQQAEMMAQNAKTAKDLSETSLDGNTALAKLGSQQ